MSLEDILMGIAVASFVTAFFLLCFLWRAFDRRHSGAVAFAPVAAPPVLSELERARMFRMIGRNHCPDCKQFGFFAGPRGLNISQNIYCTNRECRAAFNVTHFSATDGTVERIPGKEKEWYRD